MAVVGKTGVDCETNDLKTELVRVSRNGVKRASCGTVAAGTETGKWAVTVAV